MEQITQELDVPDAVVHERTPSRWGATNVILAVGIVVGVIAATIFAVLALGAGSDADAARQRTNTLRARMIVLEHRATAAEARRDRLVDLRRTAADHIVELGTALDESEAAQNAYIDAINHAADQHNAGDVEGATATYRGEAQAAFDRLGEKVTAADRALVAVQTAVHDLEEELR